MGKLHYTRQTCAMEDNMHIRHRKRVYNRKEKVYMETLHIMAAAYHRIALLNMKTGVSHLIRADSEEQEYLELSGTESAGSISYEKWLARASMELVHPDFRDEFTAKFGVENLKERFCSGEESQTFIYKCRRHVGGEYRWVQAEYVAQKKAGISDEVLYYVTDINDRWLATERNRRRLEDDLLRAEEENNIKMDFLEQFCQEVRIPVEAVFELNRLVHLSIKLEDTEKTEYYLTIMNRLTEHLKLVLSNIVDMAMVHKRGIPLVNERFDVGDLEDECHAFCQTLIHNKQISLSWTGDLQGIYLGDKERIKLALYNVIENAVKFNRTGGGIQITSEKLPGSDTADSFVFRVRDSGIGMTEEEKKKLFMPFAHRKMSSGMSGSIGIGLSVARYVLDAMGGSIQVASELGAGTVVTMKFSLQRNGET